MPKAFVRLEVYLALTDARLWSQAATGAVAAKLGRHVAREAAARGARRGQDAARRFMLGRMLVYHLCAQHAGARRLAPFATAVGQPILRGRADGPWACSLSDTGPILAAAIAPTSALGIDIESLGRFGLRQERALMLARRFFTARECAALRATDSQKQPAAFVRLWVQKEALLKAQGLGLEHVRRAAQTDAPRFAYASDVREVMLPSPEPVAVALGVAYRRAACTTVRLRGQWVEPISS